MKYAILFCLSGLSILFACNNPTNELRETDQADSTKKIVAKSAKYFYKRLEGEIAGKRVVMHLLKNDSVYSGVYYYDGSWLNLRTDSITAKDSIIITEIGTADYYFDNSTKATQLSLKWAGNGFKGTWKKNKDSKSYPVNLEEKYPEGSYKFSLSNYTDSAKAFPKKKKSPAARIDFKYLEATSKTPVGDFLNSQLKQIIGLKPNQIDWKAGFKVKAEKYFADYFKDVKEISPKNGRDTAMFWMNYTNNSEEKILYNDKNFIVLENFSASYTGGAHGNYNSEMICFDVKNKKRMQLKDITNIDSVSLQKLLESNLRKQYHIKSQNAISTVLFDNFLKPNNNFYFNDYGIAFLYNPYEVASYAQGQVVVSIPYSELKLHLNTGFIKRMNIK